MYTYDTNLDKMFKAFGVLFKNTSWNNEHLHCSNRRPHGATPPTHRIITEKKKIADITDVERTVCRPGIITTKNDWYKTGENFAIPRNYQFPDDVCG